MYYFKVKEDVIEKYQVIYDREKLTALNDRIIDECGELKHREHETEDLMSAAVSKHVKNYKSTRIMNKEYDTETRPVYHISYDEYVPPTLSRLIDRLLDGDASIVGEILNFKVPTVEGAYAKINSILAEVTDDSAEEKDCEKMFNAMESALEEKDFAEKHEIGPYYDALMKEIELKLVAVLPMSKIREFEIFFDVEFDSKMVNSQKETPYYKKPKQNKLSCFNVK